MQPFAIWFTGLSGSGKSTLSKSLKDQFDLLNIKSKILDGDVVREGLNNDLTFSAKDREENIRRIGEVNKLFMQESYYMINAFISPKEIYRKLAGDIIGQENFIEIYLSTPVETCIKRDVKGLYELAIKGKIKNFTGISDEFEVPVNTAAITINTTELSLEECTNTIMDYLRSNNRLPV
ncbi:MAG: adenylyl-sulfate kinase [Sphingobacteriales bacterium]|nr:adenylyl-sulfate kinase [Sphingobacteriales bacterium]